MPQLDGHGLRDKPLAPPRRIQIEDKAPMTPPATTVSAPGLAPILIRHSSYMDARDRGMSVNQVSGETAYELVDKILASSTPE